METRRDSPIERRYDRIAWLFDYVEFPMEMMAAKKWREKLFSQLEGQKILEVGVGTGKNLEYYPEGKLLTAIDISDRMLARAEKKAHSLSVVLSLMRMDVEALQFPHSSFDATVATFVFCSVFDPLKGLQELRRVLKPKGKAYFLEHVRPKGIRGRAFDRLNPIFARIMGANMNRETVKNIKKAGFRILRDESLFSDIFKFIVAERS